MHGGVARLSSGALLPHRATEEAEGPALDAGYPGHVTCASPFSSTGASSARLTTHVFAFATITQGSLPHVAGDVAPGKMQEKPMLSKMLMKLLLIMLTRNIMITKDSRSCIMEGPRRGEMRPWCKPR